MRCRSGKSCGSIAGGRLSYRFTKALSQLRRVVQSGELGEIFTADLAFHNAYGPQKSWFYDPELAGGECVMDLGIHLVDAALWIIEGPVTRFESRLVFLVEA
jgi:predicted dehydrogenase